jgi:hypothetical protein
MGKSTVLRAYEAAVTGATLSEEEVSRTANGQPVTVELWVHIPLGAGNVDEKWKESTDEMLLVRSLWTWPPHGGKPIRQTWDPVNKEYADDEKAAGLDTVFYSRLPRPFRIGSLDDPAEEHNKLLELILEPIKTRLAVLANEDGSELQKKISELQEEAEKPVIEFRDQLTEAQARVNASYRRVFSKAEIKLSVSLGGLTIDPSAALSKSSQFSILESNGQAHWRQQGTGSQRALFWSMLEVRSELNRISDERKKREKLIKEKEKELRKKEAELSSAKTDETRQRKIVAIEALKTEIASLSSRGTSDATPGSFLPGYMLLIDEPETALHPSAIRAAKDYLYSLAAEEGWQVMLATHHPAFVDPLKDHTTIVRLQRTDTSVTPNVYRADSMNFNESDRHLLTTLLVFDQTVAEMFFVDSVVIVEGDTEFAAFMAVMNADPQRFPLDDRPLILRARGKWTIPLLIRMLTHFKVSFAVLHDVDSPRTTSGKKRSGAYQANASITSAVENARRAGVHVIHRCSEPDFERRHKMTLEYKEKPFNAWNATRDIEAVRQSVQAVLDELCASPTADSGNHPDDGRHYEARCRAWATVNAPNDAAFAFDLSSRKPD